MCPLIYHHSNLHSNFRSGKVILSHIYFHTSMCLRWFVLVSNAQEHRCTVLTHVNIWFITRYTRARICSFVLRHRHTYLVRVFHSRFSLVFVTKHFFRCTYRMPFSSTTHSTDHYKYPRFPLIVRLHIAFLYWQHQLLDLPAYIRLITTLSAHTHLPRRHLWSSAPSYVTHHNSQFRTTHLGNHPFR